MLVAAIAVTCSGYQPTVGNLARRQAFADSKFGIFLHWGLYAQYAQGEWYMQFEDIKASEYKKGALGFYPAGFDARAWARSFRESGARYVTITARHHDGFSMFDTKFNDFNLTRTPFGRDALKELAEACRAEGLAIGFYSSLIDWTREDFPWQQSKHWAGAYNAGRDPKKQDYASYLAFMKGQLTELLTNYGPVNCIWFDGEWALPKEFDWQFDEIYSHIHGIQPDCLIINNHHHELRAGEDGQTFERDLPGENKNGYSNGQKICRAPLETCDTMVNGAWGYHVKETNWKDADTCIRYVVRAAGKGANLLLNIGPRADGRLPDQSLETLKGMGDWFREHGDTIYGTVAGPVRIGDSVVSTRKGDDVYVHVLVPDVEVVSFVINGKTYTEKVPVMTGPDRIIKVTVPGLSKVEMD